MKNEKKTGKADLSVKGILTEIFIDGLGGMATGLFATLIIGTIIVQIGTWVSAFKDPTWGFIGGMILLMGKLAQSVTGAGIGIGAAVKLKSQPLVLVSAAVSGMIGAFASKMLAGAVLAETGAIVYAGPGEPLGAFIAAMVTIYIGRLIAGKTKLDILLTPLACILSGGVVGLLLGKPISTLMSAISNFIVYATDQAPFVMGVLISVVMGMALTLPISSAAICAAFGLVGLAGGAAVAGCCAQMIGFAVMSFPENKWGGLISQGIGTSMLQMGNIVKNPRIWIAPTLTAAITGPIATCVFKLQMNGAPVSSGMGTCGLVGQIGVYSGWVADVASGAKAAITGMDWLGLILICFVLPAVLAPLINMGCRKLGWVKDGDLTI